MLTMFRSGLPTVTVKQRSQTAYAGNTIEIACNATGNPKPTIKWRRVTKTLPSNARVEQNGKLVLENIKKSDEGLYQCYAENDVGRAEDSTIVFVQGTRNCINSTFLDSQMRWRKRYCMKNKVLAQKETEIVKSNRMERGILVPIQIPCNRTLRNTSTDLRIPQYSSVQNLKWAAELFL